MLQLAAARQSRERQQGVDCSQGYMSTGDAGILFDGPRSFVCHFKYEASSRLQAIAGLTVPMMALEIAPSTNMLRFYCGTTSATAPIVPGNDYQAVVSYDGTTAVCYLNGSEAARFTVAGYAVTNVFRIGNPSYSPAGPVYSSSHYNYVLSAEEASALYNNGNPAGYVLPDYARAKPLTLKPFESWEFHGNASFDVDMQEFHLVSDGATYSAVIPLDISGIRLQRTDCIYLLRFKIKGTGSMACVDSSAIRPGLDSKVTFSATDEYVEHQVLVSFSGVNRVTIKRNTACDIYVRDVQILIVGCVAEYLPQNLVPAGPGERTPVEITENKTYTWIGVDDTTYSIRVGTSRNPVLGQWYLIKGTVSNYEAGTPYISADTGYTEFALPRGNDEFSVFAQCRSIGPSSYFFTFRGGNRNTDRRLTITIESIEPINNIASTWLDSAQQFPMNDEYLPPLLESINGYDLTANGTPEGVYKLTLKKEAKIDFTEAWSYSFNWSPAQTDAAHVVENGKIRCNCGTKTNVSHPFIYSISNTCVPGRKYRFSAKYTLLSGDIHLYGYGDLEPDTLHVVQDYGVFDTKPGQYEYTTPIMSYDQVNTRFNRCIFYWGNSISNSEFIINEIKIEEYE